MYFIIFFYSNSYPLYQTIRLNLKILQNLYFSISLKLLSSNLDFSNFLASEKKKSMNKLNRPSPFILLSSLHESNFIQTQKRP
jgi:hypothetical protein